MSEKPEKDVAYARILRRIDATRRVAFDIIAHPDTLKDHDMVKQVVATAERLIAEDNAKFKEDYPAAFE